MEFCFQTDNQKQTWRDIQLQADPMGWKEARCNVPLLRLKAHEIGKCLREALVLEVLVLVAAGDSPAPISQQSLERCGGPVRSGCLPFSGTHSAAPPLVLPGPSTATGTKPMFSVTETLRAAWSDRDVSSCGTQGYQMKAPRYIIRPSSGEVLSSGWRRCLTWKSLYRWCTLRYRILTERLCLFVGNNGTTAEEILKFFAYWCLFAWSKEGVVVVTRFSHLVLEQ